MNKRITSILLCFIMLFSMLVSAVPVYAATYESTQLKVVPDKTTANPGDIITYTIVMGPVSDMGSMQMVLDIPTGLTYVENSGKLADGLKNTLGFDAADWTEASIRTDPLYPGSMINGYASAADYECDTDTTLATFQCKVDDGFTGTVSVGLVKLEFGSCQTFEYHTDRFSVVPTAVTIEAAPVAVTGVTIDETLSVKTGESKTPSYTVNPAEATNKAVSFKSDNPAVATVNETTGQVTGVKEGTATITITTADGNFTDTCVVTVACSHANKTPVAEKASDCKNKGWDAYVKCDDCGQLFKADGTTEIAEIPFRELSGEHTGGTATCTAQAVCTVCSQPYGDLAAHSYTSADKKAEALKSEGNCRDFAIYYYSCSACGKVENNDSHTFNGDKVPGTHVGGTALVNQSEANHKTQTDGYTGDTKCLGCGEIIGRGQPIPAGAHTPANVWSTDGQYHWKECSVVGCGVVIDGSKAEHSSTGANVATCQKAAVCDVCGVSYGTVADHDWSTSWEKDATGHWHKCNTAGCTEKNAFAAHSGGTATCTAKANCSVCGEPHGDFAAHDYTAQTKKPEALKSEGNCRDFAVYYYSCSACGKVENNDSHTFNGDKVPGTHVGGTALVNQSEANHKTQTDGYTGDTKCLGCGEIIGRGQPIPAGTHTPANVWSTDGQYHWKECTVVGCGVVIDGSKAEHSSTGANVATCQKAAVCDVCGVSYGTVANHDWNTTAWESSANGHWHKCNTAGCTETNDFAAHTPDHQGGATEEYAIKCTICQFEIEAQLGHTHVFDKEVVADQYLASKANCTDPAKYYKSCKCGEKGTDTFTSGAALGHTEGTEWEKDATGHWHICTVAGCGVVIDSSKAAHTPDHQGGATEEYAIKCSVCGYEIEAQLQHTHVFDKEVAEEQYLASKANCTDPAKYYKSCKCGEKGSETFTSGEKLGHTEGTEWKKDETGHWHICTVAGCGVVIDSSKVAHTPDRDAATETDPIKCSVCGFEIAPALGHTHAHGTDWKSDKDNHWNECACGDKANTAAHKDENTDGKCDVCEYNVGLPTNPDIPQTGDNSMMHLWIILLCVSGLGVIATTVLGKKRFVK